MSLGFLSNGSLSSSVLLVLVLLVVSSSSGHDLGSDLLVSLVTFISIDLYVTKRINKIAFNLQIEFWSQLSWFRLGSIANNGG